ncbi:hypothetical protein BDV95DRAFT_483226 [Massariosphaeria phaeospora]|uniref:Uncharacterized protein n=1 Tax=Massariosphaeria phaeospora TaxID=100035 RepID=A0A7C8MH18_9PLEO|nr:hypothetical protein BDV95DRAFT_483226 [Massariosphaeria phaeospora]
MSSQDDFDAALLAPDNDVGHRFLFQITSATRFSAPSLPTTAEKYFDVFCDDTSSRIRRRWAGVALQKMIIKSDKVAKHFRTLDLQRLGHVMLSGTELEETKVVAGLIVRGAIEQKIGFTKFWPNDRVHSKEPAFPSLAEPKWMDVFQTFLDTLTEMIPPNPNGEPTVLFPISLVASDNFKWRDSTDVPMISFTQGEHLTIIIPNSTMQTFGFVDIPLARICGTHRRRSVLHDSQGKRTDHEPWDIVLELTPEPWTYLIDTTEHVGTEFTILFATEKDAKMCEQSITELVGPLTKPKASGSQLLNVSKIVTSTTSSQALKLQDTSLKKTVDKELHESNASRRPTSSQALSFGRPSASQTKDVGGASSVGERANDAAAAVNYKEPNSPLHSSSSIRPHRVEKTKNTNNAKATKTKTRPSKQPTPNISPAKHSVLANMLSKSLPTSKLGDEAKKISSNRQALTQPNDAKGSIAENDSNDMALIEVTDADSPQAELPTEAPPETTANPHLKRRAGSSPPSTPRTKRLRADNITGIETRDQPRLMMPPVSNAPLRILEDPSSPFPRIHSSGSASIELLSSNSKPMPASPHAESTAISGHADTDLVDMEKQIAEYETAKSDPFKRRVKDHKLTAFARRLTGETVSDKELEIVEVSAQDETIIAKAVETPSHILPLPKTSLAPVKAFQAEMGNPAKGWSGPSAPQQTPRDAQHEAPEHDGDVDMEGDTTLVELEGEDPTLQASPLHIPSSPPPGSPGPPDPPSSHSSTSASPESDKEPTTPPSDAEEMEWENSLNPDQRSIHDQLIRVSKRVVRHIVDNETAVNDIVDTYAKDGEHLVKTFVDRHSTAFDDQFAEISGKKQALGKEFAVLADSMAREREEWAGEISMTRRVEQARASNKGKAAVRG